MERRTAIERLGQEEFEVLVVGGGATGLGVAVDAASRGYRTALVEAHDFAQATSSRSTKLVHGGVRYLEQMDFGLVTEALRERGILYRNAPHLVRDLPFVVPRYKWWEGPFYGIGLKLYDALAGSLNLAPSRSLGHDETVAAIPNVEGDGLLGGIVYHDGQFDDARMAIALALTAHDHGAAVANRVEVVGFERRDGQIAGVRAIDREDGRELSIRAQVVVNATGIFSDTVRRLDDPASPPQVEPAQGVHLVLDRSFAPSEHAIMVPHTDDGRVLFVIPWHGCTLVGTTDTPMPRADLEPRALPEEIEFILRNAARYLARDPQRSDVRSVFAGQRPLVHRGGAHGPTKSLSRSHEVIVAPSGLVTIVGGKWTTYRKMAEDAMSHAVVVGGLASKVCITETLRVHGALDRDDPVLPSEDPLRTYGSDAAAIVALATEQDGFGEPLHPHLPYTLAQIVWACRMEMARSLEDALSRRTRCLLLDARAAAEVAPRAAAAMAAELGWDEARTRREIESFRTLAQSYTVAG
jgi:glycerol-3-phosphate dehydrogenase